MPGRQLEACSGGVLLQVRQVGGARDRQDHRGVAEEPGEGDLGGGGTEFGRDRGHLRVGTTVAPGGRTPREEGDARRRAGGEDGFVLAVEHVVPVLHARDLGDPPRLVEFGDGDLGEPDVADLALLAQLPQGAELVGEGDRGVDAVQLQEADVLAAQPPERLLDLVAQGLGPGVVVPLPRRRPGHAHLGGDQQVVGVGVQGLGEQLLVGAAAVHVGGVDEGDTEFDGAPGDGQRVLPLRAGFRRQVHRPEAEPADLQLPADPPHVRRHTPLPRR